MHFYAAQKSSQPKFLSDLADAVAVYDGLIPA